MENDTLTRYSEIKEKNKREIILLRGSGCKWRHCSFCDYHLDFSTDTDSNYELNRIEIEKVTGKYGKLEVINSGSFVDLDRKTMQHILNQCKIKNINQVHFECHWIHRNSIADLRKTFALSGIDTKIKIGVETFDNVYRETVLIKGIDETNPEKIADYFDEVCLLFGLDGQNEKSMKYDIEIGLLYFERVCINIMVENTTKIKPNNDVIDIFIKKIYPIYVNNERVDILIDNTDFGVGNFKGDNYA